MCLKKPSDDSRLALADDSERFRKAMIDLFTGRRSGHVGRYVFSGAKGPNDIVRGNEHWGSFIRHSKSYYPYLDIVKIINESAGEIGSIIADSEIFVDLGGGSIESFEQKILPIVSRSKPREFITVDLYNEFLRATDKSAMLTSIPLKISTFKCNIFEQLPALGSKATLCLLGITLGNIIADPSEKSIESALAQTFKHFSLWLQKTGGYFIFDYDTNTDGRSLEASYSNPHYHSLELTILDRALRDLQTSGLHPQQFEHVPLWKPKLRLLAQNLRAKRDLSFNIEGYDIRLPEGTLLHTGNSFKYSDEAIHKATKAAQMRKLAVFSTDKSTMRLAVYSAA